MNAARVCPTPLLDATPSTIDGFLSGRYQFAIAPSRPQFRTTRCCHSSPRPIVGPRQRGLPHAAEFHRVLAVATRPVEGNGFGWTSERTAKEVADLQERFPKLSERHESHLHSPIGRTRLLAVGLSGPPSRDRWLSGERPVPIQSIDFDKVDFVFVNFGVEGEKAGKWYESDAFVEWLSSYCMGGRIVEISREGDGEISNAIRKDAHCGGT